MAKARTTTKKSAAKTKRAPAKKATASYQLLLVGDDAHPDHDDDKLIRMLAKRGAKVSREPGGDFVAAIVGTLPDPAGTGYEDETGVVEEADPELLRFLESEAFLALPHLGDLEVSRLLAGDDIDEVIRHHKMYRRLEELVEAEPVPLDELRALARDPDAEQMFVRYDYPARSPSFAVVRRVRDHRGALHEPARR